MAITRQQSKKMNLKTAPAPAPAPTSNPSVKHKHGIDFIEASKEWRKNKVKLDNCTFDYILL
jgi:hypothetical protein